MSDKNTIVWFGLYIALKYNINYEIIVKGGKVGSGSGSFSIQKNSLPCPQVPHIQSLRYAICHSGVLVGAEDRKVSNAYPLFHTPIVNPTFSVALDLVESNLLPNERIIGFYEFVEGSECKINSLIENNPAFKSMIPMRVKHSLFRFTWMAISRSKQVRNSSYLRSPPSGLWTKACAKESTVL